MKNPAFQTPHPASDLGAEWPPIRWGRPAVVGRPWGLPRASALRHLQRLLVVLSCAWVGCLPALAATPAAEAAKTRIDSVPDPDHPTLVDVSFFIDDISDIDLNTASYRITGQMVLEWKDVRLAFEADPKHPDRPRDLDAEEAKELLRTIWDPVFEISNERGQRRTGVYSINIWPDGRIRIYEKFDSLANFRGDLTLYPYGRIDLDLVMTGFLQDRGELVYRLKKFEFQEADRADDFIHGPWSFVRMGATERSAKRSDDRSVDYSQVHFTVTLEHESIGSGSYQSAMVIFLPLLVVFLASSALIWVDPITFANPRLGGTLTLILTTIALKFSLARQLPSFNYLTLTDLYFIVTILMLVSSLSASCAALWLHVERDPGLAKRFNRRMRLAYPLLYVAAAVGATLWMVSRPPVTERHVLRTPDHRIALGLDSGRGLGADSAA
jgi:hypothetical protein